MDIVQWGLKHIKPFQGRGEEFWPGRFRLVQWGRLNSKHLRSDLGTDVRPLPTVDHITAVGNGC
jgi:hypothetical protein